MWTQTHRNTIIITLISNFNVLNALRNISYQFMIDQERLEVAVQPRPSRSRSITSTFFPLHARIRATFARGIDLPVPALQE